MKFPTTLRDLTAMLPPGLAHVYAERNGQRHYAMSFANLADAHDFAQRCQRHYPDADFYVRDRADSTAIDGFWTDAHRA